MGDDRLHRRDLLGHARADDLRAIIVTLHQRRTIAVTDPRCRGWVGGGVVRRAAGRAHPAPADAAHQLLGRDLDVDHPIDRLILLGERLVERLRLPHGAWEAIQDGSVAGIVLRQALHHHRDGQLIGDELPALHVVARFLAQLRAIAQRLAEEVAARHVWQAELLGEDAGLRPLAGADRTDEEDDLPSRLVRLGARIGHRMNPS